MTFIWWLFIFAILFYPSFIILVIFTEKYPNTKFSKWWKKHIITQMPEDYED